MSRVAQRGVVGLYARIVLAVKRGTKCELAYDDCINAICDTAVSQALFTALEELDDEGA